MTETSFSLLDRVIRDRQDRAAWEKLVAMYTPLIRGWLRHRHALEQDTDDLVQDVLMVVVRRLPEFRRQRTGSFRCWLRTITANCLRDFWKAQRLRPRGTGSTEFLESLKELEDPNSGLSRIWDEEHQRHVTRKLLSWLKPQFEEKTWRAFEQLVLNKCSPEEVAAELKMTENAVFIAKSRVLKRLREEGKDLLD